MSWKADFENAVKRYFNIPLDAEISIEDECTYYTGCPTCGGDYELFEVRVWYRNKKNAYISHRFNGKLTEFIRSLED